MQRSDDEVHRIFNSLIRDAISRHDWRSARRLLADSFRVNEVGYIQPPLPRNRHLRPSPPPVAEGPVPLNEQLLGEAVARLYEIRNLLDPPQEPQSTVDDDRPLTTPKHPREDDIL